MHLHEQNTKIDIIDDNTLGCSSHVFFDKLFSEIISMEKAYCADHRNKIIPHYCLHCCNIIDEDHVNFESLVRFDTLLLENRIKIESTTPMRNVLILDGLFEWFSYMHIHRIKSKAIGEQKYLDEIIKNYRSRDHFYRNSTIDDCLKDMKMTKVALEMECNFLHQLKTNNLF